MTEKYIIKRDGKRESFSVAKIKDVISWACGGLDVNPLVLESITDDFITSGITSVDIHNNLIHHARTLVSAEEPDWTYVAGRLRTMKRWKDTLAYEENFSDFFKERIKFGEYAEHLYNNYSDNDLEYLSSVIKQDNDLNHSYSSIVTAESKYLMEGECIQQMFLVTAMAIANNDDDKLKFAVEVYNALSERKLSLATPWLSNLRKGGNISSCFIITVDDSMEQIADAWKKAALISKNGGGLGIDLGRIRSKGASIGGNKDASKGVVSWVKIFNDIAVSVDQSGKRAGAFTTAIPIWHYDLEAFCDMQTEHGDLRSKAFDVFPQVTCPDLFFKLVESNEDWYMFCPKETKDVLGQSLYGTWGEEFESLYLKAIEAYKDGKLSLVKKLNAKQLLKDLIMKTQYETGLPYLVFLDEINRQNPNKHCGFIPCVNLCVESYSVVDNNLSHTCNLLSVVAGRMDSFDDVRKYGRLATRILDNGIELTNPPTECSKDHNSTFRTIGVGIQGLNDFLAKNYKTYSHKDFIREFAEYLEYGCIESSIKLAKEKEPFKVFDGSDWDNGERIRKFKEHSTSSLDWDYLQDQINIYGIRNSQLTSPAPNTSTSIFMDASAGVMPIYAPYFVEDNKDGGLPQVAMFLKERGLYYSQTFGIYDQTVLAEAVGELQKFVDTGISAEYLFDQNKEGFSAKTLYDCIMTAWKCKTKAVYYIRSIKKGNNINDFLGVKDADSCVGCAG